MTAVSVFFWCLNHWWIFALLAFVGGVYEALTENVRPGFHNP